VVSQAETLKAFPTVREELERLARGVYVAELVDAFTPEEQPSPELFWLLLDALRWLEAGEGPLLLRHTEMYLVGQVGYRPELFRCVVCQSPIAPNAHVFLPAQGGAACPGCRDKARGPVLPLSVEGLKALQYLQGHAYSVARRLRLSAALQRELEVVLQTYIRALLERELHSATFLERLRRFTASPPAAG
jgi:DNA repair protein RecO (recombination protein O)